MFIRYYMYQFHFICRVNAEQTSAQAEKFSGSGSDEAVVGAGRSGDVDKVGLSLEHGRCSVNSRTDRYGHEVAEMLAKEFGPSVKDLDGQSLLHVACEQGNVNLVRTILRDGKADVTARDDEGNTPLHVAAMRGRKDVVLSLIDEFGCDVNVTGQLGRSLLHSACLSNNGSLVRLVSQHISPWVVDDNGDTPLHIIMCMLRQYRECQGFART